MKRCTTCQREFDEQVVYCPFDGQPLNLYTLLDEKYRLDEKIGEGGMGQVYRATHVHIGTTFAVKLLNPRFVADQTAVERFRREARAAAQIRHPNAVMVTDFGVTKDTGVVYLVMEFLEGKNLKEKIRNQKQLGYSEILYILFRICSALQAAHTKGIVHRDLKPDNIFLANTDEGAEIVKVLDFGLAKLKGPVDATTLTEEGMIIGTPYYMSPEQCRAEELDLRSDIYSLGIILYEMLTGRVPFSAATPSAIIIMHAIEQPKSMREIRADIPRPIEETVFRALAKDPDKRQASALQLAQEFQIAIKHSGIEIEEYVDASFAQNKPSSTAQPASALQQENVDANKVEAERITAPSLSIRSDANLYAETVKISDGDLKFLNASPAANSTVENSFIANSPIANSLIAKLASYKKILYAAIASSLLFLVGIGLWLSSGPKSQPSNSETTTQNIILPAPKGMMFIPAGKFVMGNNSSDDEAEKPEHEVQVGAFFMDIFEVTNEQYYEFVNATNHEIPSGWHHGKFAKGEDNYPVVNVSWFDAQDYAQWAKKRLPTEEEWEYAARGSDRRLYPWGNDFILTNTNSKESGKNYPLPVGSYPEGISPFGLMDMAGNVAEWTASDYQLYPGSKAKPMAGYKIIRGGSFFLDKTWAMVTTRTTEEAKTYKNYLGFRCVQDLPAKNIDKDQ